MGAGVVYTYLTQGVLPLWFLKRANAAGRAAAKPKPWGFLTALFSPPRFTQFGRVQASEIGFPLSRVHIQAWPVWELPVFWHQKEW